MRHSRRPRDEGKLLMRGTRVRFVGGMLHGRTGVVTDHRPILLDKSSTGPELYIVAFENRRLTVDTQIVTVREHLEVI